MNNLKTVVLLFSLACHHYMPMMLNAASQQVPGEQEILNALAPLSAINKELSAIRTDKAALQGIEKERKDQENLERAAANTSRGRSSSGRSIHASIGSAGGRRQQKGGSSFGSGGYRSGGSRSYSSPYGSRYGNSGSRSGSSSFQKSSSSSPSSPSKRSSGAKDASSGGYKAQGKKDDKKDEKNIKTTQLKTAAKSLSAQLKKIQSIIATQVKSATLPKIKREKERAVYKQLANQQHIEQLCTSMASYAKMLAEASEESKKKTVAEVKSTSSTLHQALPVLVSLSLDDAIDPNQALKLSATLKNTASELIANEARIMALFVSAERRIASEVKSDLQKFEATNTKLVYPDLQTQPLTSTLQDRVTAGTLSEPEARQQAYNQALTDMQTKAQECVEEIKLTKKRATGCKDRMPLEWAAKTQSFEAHAQRLTELVDLITEKLANPPAVPAPIPPAPPLPPTQAPAQPPGPNPAAPVGGP